MTVIDQRPVITDKAAAVAALVGARAECVAIRNSTLPGTALYLAMGRTIHSLSGAIKDLGGSL